MTKKIIISLATLMMLSACSAVSAHVEMNLPLGPVTMYVKYPSSQSYFNTQLKSISSGYDVQNGTYIDWCTAKNIFINPNYNYTNTHLYSIYNTSMPSYLWHSNWSKINYILNHKIQNADWKQIQYAIWYLLDYGNSGLNSDGWSMVQNASLYGESYSPTYFDIIGIIADAGQNIQRQLLELRIVDPNGDADGDGVKNINEDVDSNGNPNNDDTDSDGIPNYLDSDDDGDNILTIVEVTDGNQFGQDVDNDGTPNYLDTNSDGDRKRDVCEGTGDIDGDGIPNYLDSNDEDGPNGDLDGDGLQNYIEDNLGTNKTNPDSDGDSLNDYTETKGGSPFDSDNDTVIDANDPDDDGDGILTIVEVTDGNKFGQDVDNDGLPNYLDTDSDGDGLLDQDEGTGDHDGDGIPNYLDPDDRQAPSKVENLSAIDVKDGKIDLSWNPATDNVGVEHYEICRDGNLILNITGTVHQDTGLSNGHSYHYTVRAVDTAGNQGNFSDPAIGTPTKTTHYNPPQNNENNNNNNQAPIANASAGEPYTGVVNENITFNASYSSDPDHDVLSYYWDFGDGTISAGEIVTHVYTTAGEYNVTLRVTDNHGKTGSDVTVASVLEASKPLSQPDVTGPSEGYINIAYTFSIIVNDTTSNIKFIIDWDDGNNSESGNHAEGLLFMINHTWTKPGEYNITVTVSDDQTAATTRKIIEIYPPNASGKIPESSNFLLILLALLALMFLLFFLLLGKRRKDEEEEEK
jgi:chitodextrinase